MFGLGVVALCAPPAAELGIELVNLGTKVLQARNTFAERAASGLNALQEALPFLAAASAYATASSNSGGAMAASYLGIAMLVPAEGERIEVAASKALSDAADAVSEDAESLKQASEEAEEAAKEAFSAKEEGFKRDCGDAPAYCMYERAEALSSISSTSNPLFHTVDAWSFSVALDRAKAYYSARFEDEAPQSSAIEEQVESALRKVFYRFALAEVSRGFVLDTGDSFDAFFPLLPKNTAEMKATRLYADPVFPLGKDSSGVTTLHAWGGCPNASPSMGTASIAQMETGNYPVCDVCRFTASSLGRVAAASSSISNGFEYHYSAVARAAADYTTARAKQDEAAREVKGKAGGLLEKCKEALSEIGGMRIDAKPPGYKGAISMVVNLVAAPADTGFASSFVGGSSSLGASRRFRRNAARGGKRRGPHGRLLAPRWLGRRRRSSCWRCAVRARCVVARPSRLLRRARGDRQRDSPFARFSAARKRKRFGRMGGRQACGHRRSSRVCACETGCSQARTGEHGVRRCV